MVQERREYLLCGVNFSEDNAGGKSSSESLLSSYKTWQGTGFGERDPWSFDLKQ